MDVSLPLHRARMRSGVAYFLLKRFNTEHMVLGTRMHFTFCAHFGRAVNKLCIIVSGEIFAR